MAKSKVAPKAALKNLLVTKGEYLALGLSGVVLALLLVWGATRWSGAKDPDKTAKELSQKAQGVYARIQSTDPAAADGDEYKLPEWVVKPYQFKTAPADDFRLTGPQFDPIAKPDTKREKPVVHLIERYQVDLVRGAMLGYDVVLDANGDPSKIGVIVSRKSGPQDRTVLDKFGETVKGRVQGRPGGRPAPPPAPKVDAPGGGFDASAQRVEKGVEYIPVEEVTKAISERGRVPASAVVPLRMIVLNAEVPYKKQVEEIKRALRLPSYADAQRWGPIYDGFEVQRRVTRVVAGGKPEVVQDWPADNKPNFDFEGRYADLIARRKFEDSLEDGYLSHFIRYDMALALPLPKLVLGSYPGVQLDAINATIREMKKRQTPPATPSVLEDLLKKRPPRDQMYQPANPAQTGGGLVLADDPMGSRPPAVAPPVIPGKVAPVRPGEKGNQEVAPPVEIEQLLLRLVDVDVRPGYTYEYKIRLRMLNPNEGQPVDVVANPAFTKEKVLFSPWALIAGSVTVPGEAFQFAADPAAYRKRVEDEYAKEARELRDRVQARDNQVVVEQLAWLEQVRTDAGGKREPVGAWVVADVPVGRGEYVGRKQYVKLPVWSSVNKKYELRETPDKLVVGKKDVTPRGWLLDFSADKSILVDFEGGRVTTTRAGGSRVTEDAAAELLIVRPDGSLVVRSSETDEANPDRRKLAAEWEKWVKEVEKSRAATGDPNEFSRPDMKN